MRHKLLTLIATMIFGAMAAYASGTGIPDATLQTRVNQRLHDANFDSVTATVNNQVATLTGAVDRLAKSEKAYQIARKTKDISSVGNNIEVRSTRTDEEIGKDVTHEIRMFPFYNIFDWINGDVKDGVVTLTGYVRLPWRFNDYANLAKQVSGVKAVDNQLEILPTSAYDDQIRARVARAIYGSPSLGMLYGHQALPPIHIIVKNGDVRLEGVVVSQVDKQLASQAARFAATYFNLENDLQVVKG